MQVGPEGALLVEARRRYVDAELVDGGPVPARPDRWRRAAGQVLAHVAVGEAGRRGEHLELVVGMVQVEMEAGGPSASRWTRR